MVIVLGVTRAFFLFVLLLFEDYFYCVEHVCSGKGGFLVLLLHRQRVLRTVGQTDR